MQINHNGFVYRTAYPFSGNQPSKVNICPLFWRFVGVGLGRLIASILLWVCLGFLFGVFAFGLVGLPLLLIGRKFVYLPDRNLFKNFVLGGNAFGRILFPHYDMVPMECLPVIGGRRVLPIVPIAAILVALLLWYAGSGVVHLLGQALSTLANDIWEGVTGIVSGGVIGQDLFWFIFAPAVVILLGVRLGEVFFKSESGRLLVAYLKAKKEKVCIILEVV